MLSVLFLRKRLKLLSAAALVRLSLADTHTCAPPRHSHDYPPPHHPCVLTHSHAQTHLSKQALQPLALHHRVCGRQLQQGILHPLHGQGTGQSARQSGQESETEWAGWASGIILQLQHSHRLIGTAHQPGPISSTQACLHRGLIQALLAAVRGCAACLLRGPELQALGAAALDQPAGVCRAGGR